MSPDLLSHLLHIEVEAIRLIALGLELQDRASKLAEGIAVIHGGVPPISDPPEDGEVS